MENNTFQPSPKMLSKLFEYGQQKSFKEGDVILVRINADDNQALCK